MKTKINSPEHVTELLRNVGKVILLKRKRNKLRGWLVHPPLMEVDGFTNAIVWEKEYELGNWSRLFYADAE